ncbi:MAG: two-component regulator propeller domain-containing protein, partial [Bacteroidota bacterium]
MQAKFWMLLLAALIGTSVLTAQYPQLRHFTREDGLPSNNVYSIIQDDRGYIWVCTDQGIACFNGQSFEVFTIHDGLTDNDVWALRKDQRGRIWMDSFRGVCYLEEGKI